MRYNLLVFFLLMGLGLSAQTNVPGTFSLSGQLTDKKDHSPLQYVGVSLRNPADSTFRKGVSTDTAGNFTFHNLAPGQYSLQVNNMGYLEVKMPVKITDASVQGLSVQMEADPEMLKQVDVVTMQERVKQKGDTTEINAAAYKVNKDATVEDLVNKMPGITNDGGTLKAGGEEIKKVTIDGREFFGDDATMALKNLPAEIVDKVQIFDRQTDQAAFTGFSDGNTDKTLNIRTKSGKSNGMFGKVYAGAGTNDNFSVSDGRYSAGGNLNFFKGARRISILGMSNNINMQNFSSQDLLGVSQSSGGSSGGSRGGMGGGGGRGGGGNASSNFLTGQNNGINTTHSLGFNYSDDWGKKWKATASYFFNSVTNNNGSNTERQYFLSHNQSQFYHETNTAKSTNDNHRLSGRLTWTIDTMNSVIFTPRLSFQQNKSTTGLVSNTISSENALLNQAATDNFSKNMGYTLSNGILYQHKFLKRGRTISFNLQTDFNGKSGNGGLNNITTYYDSLSHTTTINQRSVTSSGGYTISPNVSYTEPLSKQAQLMFSYSPSFSKNTSEKTTNDFDPASNEYTYLDSTLTNNFDNKVITQRGGLNYRLNGENFNFNMGADYQSLELSSVQTFPLNYSARHNFQNVLPRMFYRYKFSKRTNIRVSYNGSTRTPSISQLQNVLNNSNPLQLSSGNPDLKQQFDNSVTARFQTVDSSGTRPLFLLLSYTNSSNYIGNSTVVAKNDTLVGNAFILSRGGQFTQPVNLKTAYMSVRSFMTLGVPLTFMKSNLNLNAGFTYSKSPSLINNITNLANTYNMNAGLIIGSNISEKVDFKVSYSGNYYIVKNSIRPQLDNNYYTGVASAKVNFLIAEKWNIGSDLNLNHYIGLGAGYNQNIYLWNGYLAYKFLKNKAGELRLYVYDILKRNKSIVRNVTETYVEDVQTNVLQRYYLLTFTYNIRSFKAQPDKNADQSRPFDHR